MPGVEMSPVYRIFKGFWFSLDWVFPPQCAGCGHTGFRWCPNCDDSIKRLDGDMCPRCGQPYTSDRECSRCLDYVPAYIQARSVGVYAGSLRNAILHLKYQHDLGLGDVLAQPLADLVLRLNWNLDIIVPVPLDRARQAERGFNQVASLARPLAWKLGLPYRPGALVRSRQTASQVGLSLEERRLNVRGAFTARERWVEGKRVLLVDDVMTTGATLDACAQALVAANASGVYALTLGRATDAFSLP